MPQLDRSKIMRGDRPGCCRTPGDREGSVAGAMAVIGGHAAVSTDGQWNLDLPPRVVPFSKLELGSCRVQPIASINPHWPAEASTHTAVWALLDEEREGCGEFARARRTGWRQSVVLSLSVLRRAYVARINSSRATAPSGFRYGSRWMMEEIWARGPAAPNSSTVSGRMK